MPSVTLPESAKLAQDQLVAGVIESLVTVNQFYQVLPFQGIDGNALSYNRENALGDIQTAAVGDTITAKAAATFTKVTADLTTIIGDAEINGLIQATRSATNDQAGVQVASKAKNAGRKYQDMLINGTGAGSQFEGLASLVPAGQSVAAGGPLTFELLDEMLHKVQDKDGEVDYIQMADRDLRKYNSLLRGLGGASIGEVVTLPNGAQVPAYSNIPIFRNNWIATDGGVGSNESTVFAGTLDDGSMNMGIAGLTASKASGIQIKPIGESETKDEEIIRVKWYCGFALFSELGISALTGVTPT